MCQQMHIQLPLKVIPYMLLYLPAYVHTLSVCQAGCLLSWVHMHNLHPGANLHPGYNFLHPGCIFGHVNGVLRICTGWSKFICTRVQFVHMNAKCLISIRFDREF